ncbi:hypothetical protein BVX97_02855 [bacterium E08(2017)]|nr:hypothetical protein BVX97_02855 [bacterium E08(2017)]
MAVNKRKTESYYLNTRPFDPVGLLSIKTDDNYFARILHAETGHYNHPTGKRLKSHSHNVYHLKLVTGGRGFFLIDDELYATDKGKLFLVGPNQSHCFMNASGDSTVYSEVTFEFINSDMQQMDLPFHTMVASLLNQYCTPVTTAKADPDVSDAIDNQISRMIEAGNQGEHDSHLWQISILAEMLFSLYENIFRPQTTEHITPIERACYYMQRNYAQKITLEQLASVAHLTPNYLSRYFKKTYGMTPINYLLKLRIDAACAILETTEDSLKYVSSRVGFTDHYYFSRVFRKLKGMPPGEYRKKLHQRT